jgi:hypothetical protein
MGVRGWGWGWWWWWWLSLQCWVLIQILIERQGVCVFKYEIEGRAMRIRYSSVIVTRRIIFCILKIFLKKF